MCPKCGYIDIFGVAISPKHHREILEILFDKKERGIGKHELYQMEKMENGCPKSDYWLDVYE
jgi:hypothetical protein